MWNALAELLGDMYTRLEAIGTQLPVVRASTILSGLQFADEQKSWCASRSGTRSSFSRGCCSALRAHSPLRPAPGADGRVTGWRGRPHSWSSRTIGGFLDAICTDSNTQHCWQQRLTNFKDGYSDHEAQLQRTLDAVANAVARLLREGDCKGRGGTGSAEQARRHRRTAVELSMRRCHLLLLEERRAEQPTNNHIDLGAVDALNAALVAFEGGLSSPRTSHARLRCAPMEAACDDVWLKLLLACWIQDVVSASKTSRRFRAAKPSR